MESVPAPGTWADFWEPIPQDGLPHPALIQGKDTGPAPNWCAMNYWCPFLKADWEGVKKWLGETGEGMGSKIGKTVIRI